MVVMHHVDTVSWPTGQEGHLSSWLTSGILYTGIPQFQTAAGYHRETSFEGR